MGLPDEGIGLPKKRSRLCLNSKRKDSPKEAVSADNHNKTSSNCTFETMAATQDAVVLEERQNPPVDEMFFSDNRDSLVAPVSSLYNLGNTCFLNCMLQVLRYTPGFLGRLVDLRHSIGLEESRIEEKEPQSKKNERPVWKLVVCLDNLYKQMRNKESDYKDIAPTDSAMMAIRPDALLEQIRNLNPLFEGNFQHDAQELLRCLLGCLDDAELELEKEEMERKNIDEKSNCDALNEKTTNLRKENKGSDGQKKVFSASGFQTYGKKRKKKEQDSSHSSAFMVNVLNREKSKSLPPSQLIDSQANKSDAIDQVRTEESIRLSEEETKSKEMNGYINNKAGGKDETVITEEKNDVHFVGTELNTSWDASKCGFSRQPLKQMYSPSKEGKKSMRLGIREQLARMDKEGMGILNPIHKEQNDDQSSENESKDKCNEEVNKNSVIYISDEEDDSTSPFNDKVVTQSKSSSSCHDIVMEEEEELIPSSSDKPVNSSCGLKTKKRKSPEKELTPVLNQDTKSQFMVLSPGKQLIIHSPEKTVYSPKLPSSRHFLSRIQSFLPHSAKKMLNFSFDQTPSPSLVTKSETSFVPDNFLENESKETIQNKVYLGGGNSLQIPQECLYEAKLTLKRCDWLGVSPVKSISASFVLERMRNQSEISSTFQVKRKCEGDSLEDCEKGGKKCKLNEENKKRKVTNEKGDMENLSTVNRFETVTSETGSNRKIVSASSNPCNDKSLKSKKYQRCKIKPFSINLKKLDWLADSKKQSFTLQEIMEKSESKVPVQNFRDKKCLRRQMNSVERHVAHCTLRDEVPDGCSEGHLNTQGKQDREKLVQGLFGGVMSHRTCCCECELTSDRPEKFLDVSIPVQVPTSEEMHGSGDEDEEGNDTENSVFRLLKSFSSRERLCNDNKYFCDQCFHLVEAEHFCYFQELPKILAIHLKRFNAGLGSYMGQVSKISDHVSVPASLPCLMMKCSHLSSCCHHRYSLYAVVTHSGSSILRGHYRSYVKVSSSFNQQILHHVIGNKSHREMFSDSFSVSSSLTHDDNDTSILTNASNSLVGDTLDVKNFIPSHKSQSANDRQFPWSASMCSHRREEKSWWLECDDEFIRIFEEEEFLERLSGEAGSLLGTPYVLFYHQN